MAEPFALVTETNWTVWVMGELLNGVHIMPNSDLVEHEFSDECVCGPVVEAVPDSEGNMGWLHTHQALDGRK